MKIGVSGPNVGDYDVRLPEEVIAIIVLSVRQIPNEDLRRYTLWSCCLLSRAWYSISIEQLYERPQLSNKNFDTFARTICPPVNSRVRKVGLESFIRHLDMGHLAYESTRSLTARLVRRARGSLETFVAPAVSFSITSLAPLSRCGNLRSLDLSRDHYDVDLNQLLNAIGDLPHLTSLSLPRGAMNRDFQLDEAYEGGSCWPPKLKQLQINDHLPQSKDNWVELLKSWPRSLGSVSFEDCLNWNQFYLLGQIDVRNEGVKTISVGIRREEEGFPIATLLTVFSNLVHLAIPTPARIPEFMMAVGADQSTSTRLEHLTFRMVPAAVQPKGILTTRFLSSCVETFSTLVRVDVPEHYLDVGAEESEVDLEHIEKLMNTRSGHLHGERGVFLTAM